MPQTKSLPASRLSFLIFIIWGGKQVKILFEVCFECGNCLNQIAWQVNVRQFVREAGEYQSGLWAGIKGCKAPVKFGRVDSGQQAPNTALNVLRVPSTVGDFVVVLDQAPASELRWQGMAGANVPGAPVGVRRNTERNSYCRWVWVNNCQPSAGFLVRSAGFVRGRHSLPPGRLLMLTPVGSPVPVPPLGLM